MATGGNITSPAFTGDWFETGESVSEEIFNRRNEVGSTHMQVEVYRRPKKRYFKTRITSSEDLRGLGAGTMFNDTSTQSRYFPANTQPEHKTYAKWYTRMLSGVHVRFDKTGIAILTAIEEESSPYFRQGVTAKAFKTSREIEK